jgi:hypothetical protein
MELLKKAAFPFIGGSYQSRSIAFDGQRTINLYPELSSIGGGKNGEVGALYSCPGLKLAQVLGAGPIRGAHLTASANLGFVVSGNEVFQISSAQGTPIAVSGNLLTSQGTVSIADNGEHILIVDGQYGYTINLTSPSPSLVLISDPNFFPADTVDYLGGYFILDKKGTSNFFLSDIDSIDFPPLNESSALASTDNVLAVKVLNNQVFIFGTRTIEVWILTGASASAPFERQSAFNTGLTSHSTIFLLANTLLWLGGNEQGDGIVFSMENNSPTRVSTHAIEHLLQSQGDLSSCTAFGYQEDGHYFYLINVPSANTTYVYDLATKMWFERQSTHPDGTQRRHFGEKHIFLNGKHIIGDYRNGKIYTYDYAQYTDDGAILRRRRLCPIFAQGVQNIFPATLEVDIQAGVGTATLNPRLAMRVSKNGGFTFGNPIYASMGKEGQFTHRARWQRLPYGKSLVFDVWCDDPVNVVLLSAWMNAEIGSA